VDGQPVIYRLSDGPKKIFTQEELLVVPSDTMLPSTHILY
ncbi:6209_t:CDS:1, partial [Rhizophagus irregularis]